jgi:hypothetical protein
MALTEEIQAQMAAHQAAQLVVHQEQIVSQRESENARHKHEKDMEDRRAKLELLRMARDTLAENARNKPTEEAGVSAADIVAFANELTTQLTQHIGD